VKTADAGDGRMPASRALHSGFLACSTLLIGLACAIATHRVLQSPQVYPQLVTGSLAWDASSKSGELAAVIAFLLAVPLAWWALRACADLNDDEEPASLHALQLACVPGAVWLGQVLYAPSNGTGWLYVSAALIGWWAVGASAARAATAGTAERSEDAAAPDAMAFMLIPIFAGFSALGVLLFMNRGLLLNVGVPAFPIGFTVAATSLLIRSRASRADATAIAHWRRGLILSQAGIPLLAAGVLPTPLKGAAGLLRVEGVSVALVAVSVLIAMTVLLDIVRCALREVSDLRTLSVASPLAMFLCLWILRAPFTEAPSVPVDDWHFGELLLPWASLRDFGLVPYADLIPVRGLISFVEAALAQLFMTGSAADIASLRPVIGLIYSAVAFFSMRYASGALAALLVVAVLDFASPITRIDYFFVAGVSVLVGLAVRELLSSASLVWLLSSIVFFILAPGQAILYAVATGPLMLYTVFNASKRTRVWLAASVLLTFSMVAALVRFQPTAGRVWAGIGFYFADNVAINATGSGISWVASFGSTIGGSPVVREGFRSFFLVVAVGAIWAAVTAWQTRRGTKSMSTFRDAVHCANSIDVAIPVSILFTVLVFLPRVLGRIDIDNFSRLGALTLLACAIVPLITRRRFDAGARGLFAVIAVFIASAVHVNVAVPSEGATPFTIAALRVPRQFNVADSIVNARLSHLHRAGTAKFNVAHLAELQQLRVLFDEMLPTRSPYFDFTNRNAHYVYFERPPATRWSAPYYLADERAQVRTASELAAQRVPLLLLKASNIEHDGGTAALRAYWLYRFVLTEYVPFEREGFIFAVHRDLTQQPGFARFVSRSAMSHLALFEQAFASTDLERLPEAWGASERTLEHSFTASRLEARAVDSIGGPTVITPATDSAGRAELPRFDMLRLEMRCAGAGQLRHRMQLRWRARSQDKSSEHEIAFTATSGVLLIPLGARPAWILADEITRVTVETNDTQAEGGACVVARATWMQRKRPE
jgi:hypothetical protein